MKWEDKVELARLNNNKSEKELIDFFTNHIDDIDPQAMDMFIYAIRIDEQIPEKLCNIKDFILQYDSSLLDFREGLRLETIKEILKENSHDKRRIHESNEACR